MSTKIQTKKLTAKTTADVRKITTNLVNKEELFRMFALAEATGLPLLLEGPPGTGKTKSVLDYAKAKIMTGVDTKNAAAVAQANKDFMDKVYILETDEGTKASEIKGLPDMKSLMENNEFKLSTPIADAEVVIVNEIDKASSSIRNSLLGVMNEKFIFNGRDKIPCRYKLFIGTCNAIPKEEKNSPFWDRFILKANVSRVNAGELLKYFSSGAKAFRQELLVGVPTMAEIDGLQISAERMEKYMAVAYTKSSDRTLTFTPTLIKAVAHIWNCTIDKAMIKVCDIMIGSSESAQLSNMLISNESKTVLKKIDMLHSCKSGDEINELLKEIESLVNLYSQQGKMGAEEIEEFSQTVAATVAVLDMPDVEGDVVEAILDDSFAY